MCFSKKKKKSDNVLFPLTSVIRLIMFLYSTSKINIAKNLTRKRENQRQKRKEKESNNNLCKN